MCICMHVQLLGEIFNNDMNEFRSYCTDEDVWTKVVEVLDDHDGAGWDLLKSLCFARETAVKNAKNTDSLKMLTVRGLLSSSRFFAVNRR
jgi:hypothetical protein